MRVTFIVAIAVGACSVGSSNAAADPTCLGIETVAKCMARFGIDAGEPPSSAAPTAAVAAAEVPGRVAGKSTGDEADLPNAETAIRNFIPRFAVAALTPGISDDSGALGLKFNLPLNDGSLFDWGSTLQIEAVANKPQVNQAILDVADEAERAALKDRLQKSLQTYDDLALRLALNVENRRFGRSVRPQFDLVARLARDILRPLDEAEHAAWQAFLRSTTAAQADMPDDRKAAPECKDVTEFEEYRLDCFSTTSQALVISTISAFADAAENSEKLGAKMLEAGGFYRLADLINNQPQFNGRVEYRGRRDLVGPNQWGGQLRLEVGLANLNGLRRYCGTARPDVTADCLRRYVGEPAVRHSIGRSDRVWAQIDVARQHAYALDLPADGITVANDPAWKVTPGIGYGAYVGQNKDGTDRGRLDFQFQYVFESKAKKRQDRAVGTLTFTQRLTDQGSALITISYSNRPEFLGAVDKKLSATLGVSYKVLQPKK